MTLDEISVVFSADTAPFSAAVGQVSALLTAASSEAAQLSGAFTAAGSAAGDGLSAGILARKSSVIAAAQAVASAAASALKSALAIHSPSRLTYQVGAFFDQGLLNGISAGAGQVEKEAASLGRSAADALSLPEIPSPDPSAFSLPNASAPSGEEQQSPAVISLTVPLEIDGYRLGVAAIEGINRVTNGTGRIELSL